MKPKTKQRATRTMYMHTIDGRPAYVLRFTRGRTVMHPYAKTQRARLLSSLGEVRREWNECIDSTIAELERVNPHVASEITNDAAHTLLSRLGYVRVEVPLNAR